ncbi:unnamed protein product [Boreogadus saida]
MGLLPSGCSLFGPVVHQVLRTQGQPGHLHLYLVRNWEPGHLAHRSSNPHQQERGLHHMRSDGTGSDARLGAVALLADLRVEEERTE